MDLKKATSYIDALYEKRAFSKKGYIEATELQEFGTVVDDDVSDALCLSSPDARTKDFRNWNEYRIFNSITSEGCERT